ncbi:transglutaminaseTgpA domain-containing protein, partial [Klebsiella pneumoniae]|nr:transglutaminaseTgpA domain-containing protein [Klebsiella pneumoniae]
LSVLLCAIAILVTSARLTQPSLALARGLRSSLRLLGGALPLMLLLFVLFPRIDGPLWGMPGDAFSAVSGLSSEMQPGS